MERPSSYPVELRKRAVRMVAEVRGDYPNESAALRAVAQKNSGSVRPRPCWMKRDEVYSRKRPGTTTEESAQIRADGSRRRSGRDEVPDHSSGS